MTTTETKTETEKKNEIWQSFVGSLRDPTSNHSCGDNKNCLAIKARLHELCSERFGARYWYWFFVMWVQKVCKQPSPFRTVCVGSKILTTEPQDTSNSKEHVELVTHTDENAHSCSFSIRHHPSCKYYIVAANGNGQAYHLFFHLMQLHFLLNTDRTYPEISGDIKQDTDASAMEGWYKLHCIDGIISTDSDMATIELAMDTIHNEAMHLTYRCFT